MNYADGKPVKLGDIVNLGPVENLNREQIGTVVCLIDENLALDGFNAKDWLYLTHGVLFESELCGLTYFKTPDEDTVLISRVQTKP